MSKILEESHVSPIGVFRDYHTGSSTTYYGGGGRRAEILVSFGNPAPYRRGDNFRQRSASFIATPTESVSTRIGVLEYNGSFVDPRFSGIPSTAYYTSFPSQGAIDANGAIGYNRYKPDKAIQNVGEALGELRDVSQLMSKYRWGLKTLSDIWLDYNYGRGAVIRDIIALYNTQQKLAAQMAFLRKQNGRRLRRGGSVYTTSGLVGTPTESNLVGGAHTYPILPSYFYTGRSLRTQYQTSFERWWFSGAFRVYMPPGRVDDNRWPPGLTAKLLGVTPDVVWQLMPWAWLTDWFANTGSVLSNIVSVATGLVSDYAYIMCEAGYESHSVSRFRVGGKELTASTYARSSTKLRNMATPYGFGLNPGAFTGAQLATLAALGINTLPNGKFIGHAP